MNLEGLWRRAKEREFKIWAAENLLLVKIPLAEVNFKASFECREGRVVRNSEKERIQDLYCTEGKIPCCFLLKVGMRKVLPSEDEPRDLEGT